MGYNIDWKIVGDNLKCPKCGDKAHIDPGSDGYEASHIHRFKVSRIEARRITEEFSTPLTKVQHIIDTLSDDDLNYILTLLKEHL